VSGGCGDVTYQGLCAGSVVTWCESGSIHTKDCAPQGRACGWQDDTVGWNCLDGAPPAAPAPSCDALGYDGRCDGATLWWCEGGAVKSYDCGAINWTCGLDGANGYNCKRPYGASSFSSDGKAPRRLVGGVASGLVGGCDIGQRSGDPLRTALLLSIAGLILVALRRRSE
jgi:hypothetical protein